MRHVARLPPPSAFNDRRLLRLLAFRDVGLDKVLPNFGVQGALPWFRPVRHGGSPLPRTVAVGRGCAASVAWR